jgi:ferric-dicitrate binding protein FerR (iron transport regulator)
VKEQPHPPGAGGIRHGDDEEIAALLQSLSARERVPEHELPPIKAAARDAWMRQVRRTTLRRRAAYAAVAIAAGVVLAIGIGVLRPDGLPPSPSTIAVTLETVVGDTSVGGEVASAAAREVASGTAIVTGDGGRTALRLPSGHSVRVDVATSVRIVSDGSLRLDRGAIYVDTETATAPDGASIEIDTPFGLVTDLGTRFEVRLIPAQGLAGPGDAPSGLRIAVRDGKVRLATSLGDYEAAAGSELSFYAGGRLDRAAAPPYGSSWGWVETVRPLLSIEGTKLTDFLDWAAHESGRRWRFTESDRSLRNNEVVLHGSIDGMTVEEALATVLPSCGLRHRVEGDELLIENDG